MNKKYPVLLLFFLFVNFNAKAQSTETFEDELSTSSSFTDNGETFDITSTEVYDVYVLNGSGWNGTAPDNKFIDNSNSTTNGGGTGFTIKQDDGDDFLVIDLYLFCSRYNLMLHSGTLTITGRRDNSDVYSFSKSSGFSNTETFSPNNGFTYIDFATEGAADYSDDPIDELVFSSTGDLDYMALDAFQWELIVLPVELISFNGNVVDNTIHLTWVTAQELNNEKFEIEKSLDGVNFNKIGEVMGNRTTLLKHDYSFIDQTPSNNIYYYRLKQIDFDGEFEFSRIISIDYKEGKTQLGKLYPNPAAPGPISLGYHSIVNGEVNISIFDVSGKAISNQVRQVSIGQNVLSFNTSDLKQGIYIINIASEINSFSYEFLIN